MPYFPIGSIPAQVKSFSASLIDRSGGIGSVSVEIAGTVTDGELADLAGKLGAVSNAGMVSYTNTTRTGINPKNALAYDEAENNVSTKAELVFMDNNLKTRSVSIPAPDAQFFAEDKKTIANTGNMASLITALELTLNGGAGGAGTFVYQRGYLVSRSRKAVKSAVTPAFSEPAALQSPSDAPAV